MDKNKIKSQFLSELSESSDHTKQGRIYYCGKFLDFAGDTPFSEWNKGLVTRFINQLRDEGYSPGTVRLAYSIVKRVFDAARSVHEADRVQLISSVNSNDPSAVAEVFKAMSLPGPNWDLGKRSAPKVETQDVVKPAVTLEEISAMVAAARSGVLTTGEAAYLALSSIYGLRREELCRVRPEHLDFDMKRIYVMTAKGGERRFQLLCNEILPFLRGYGFPPYSLFRMSELYHKICYKSGVEMKEGGGLHAIRRFLDTELVKACGELRSHIFLRWKISSSSLMVERYFSENPLDIDKFVLYNGHPVVPLWR